MVAIQWNDRHVGGPHSAGIHFRQVYADGADGIVGLYGAGLGQQDDPCTDKTEKRQVER